MKTFTDIVDLAGGGSALARELGTVSAQTACNWRGRDFIPPQHWRRLCVVMAEHRVHLTLERLCEMAEARQG